MKNKSNLKMFWEGLVEGKDSFQSHLSSLPNFIILSGIYFVGISFTSLLAKLTKQELLDKDLSSDKSYWKPSTIGNKKMETYYRQF
jgi:glycine/D-amino acid oxidase-like deaminating enzyme